MKKIFLLLAVLISVSAMAQTTDTKKKKVAPRTKDHLMFQFGYDAWTNRPDSVRTGGFSRHFNMYFMFDKQLKSNDKLSLGIGVGMGSSNIFFNKTNVDVNSNTIRLPFTLADSLDHFRKFKVTNIYLELPIELRYFSNPNDMNRSWKAAFGAKVGTLIKTFSKGKDYENRLNQSIYGTSYIMKENSKKFFNNTAVTLTGRLGYGIIGIQGNYQLTSILKDGAGATMYKYSIGIYLSGL